MPGWLETAGLGIYSPLSSRAERGDPVNKKALRAFARRHTALDCHSRTTTFSTLFVLLRNDKGARISPTPRRTTCDTPPAPGAVGIHTTGATNYYNSFRSWAVGIRPPRRLRRHPSAEGNLLRSRCGLSSPPLEGWHEVPGWLETAELST